MPNLNMTHRKLENRSEMSPKNVKALFSFLKCIHQHCFTVLRVRSQTQFQTFFTTRSAGMATLNGSFSKMPGCPQNHLSIKFPPHPCEVSMLRLSTDFAQVSSFWVLCRGGCQPNFTDKHFMRPQLGPSFLLKFVRAWALEARSLQAFSKFLSDCKALLQHTKMAVNSR